MKKTSGCFLPMDGNWLFLSLVYFSRLLKATPAQRHHFETSGGGIGLHWKKFDEDISVEGLLLGFGDTKKARL